MGKTKCLTRLRKLAPNLLIVGNRPEINLWLFLKEVGKDEGGYDGCVGFNDVFGCINSKLSPGDFLVRYST